MATKKVATKKKTRPRADGGATRRKIDAEAERREAKRIAAEEYVTPEAAAFIAMQNRHRIAGWAASGNPAPDVFTVDAGRFSVTCSVNTLVGAFIRYFEDTLPTRLSEVAEHNVEASGIRRGSPQWDRALALELDRLKGDEGAATRRIHAKAVHLHADVATEYVVSELQPLAKAFSETLGRLAAARAVRHLEARDITDPLFRGDDPQCTGVVITFPKEERERWRDFVEKPFHAELLRQFGALNDARGAPRQHEGRNHAIACTRRRIVAQAMASGCAQQKAQGIAKRSLKKAFDITSDDTYRDAWKDGEVVHSTCPFSSEPFCAPANLTGWGEIVAKINS